MELVARPARHDMSGLVEVVKTWNSLWSGAPASRLLALRLLLRLLASLVLFSRNRLLVLNFRLRCSVLDLKRG